jgi:hypothetical protein
MWFLIRQVEDFGYFKNPIYGILKDGNDGRAVSIGT